MLGWEQRDCRPTIGGRYKKLSKRMQAFVLFIAQNASELFDQFDQIHLVEDRSLFIALGPVLQETMRNERRIPPNLRHLDTEATWSKSAYHG